MSDKRRARGEMSTLSSPGFLGRCLAALRSCQDRSRSPLTGLTPRIPDTGSSLSGIFPPSIIKKLYRQAEVTAIFSEFFRNLRYNRR
ncbi:hypothetical protein OR1_01923 [Geobacter sp. OR-1]|nr:hypothetical protein OR1_01923 [Geobacter sp. OR-1]